MASEHSETQKADDFSVRKRVSRQREDFLSALIYDMKTPLIGADRILDLFVQGTLGPLTEQQTLLLFQLRESNKAVLDMVGEMIDTYAIEQEHVGQLSSLDLSAVLNQIISARRKSCESKQIKIIADLTEQTNFVKADAHLMYRAMENLLDHMIKRSQSGDTIELRVVSEPDSSVVHVTAPNRPITAIERETLLNASADDNPRYKPGAILKLHICKIIIEAHNGTLDTTHLETAHLEQLDEKNGSEVLADELKERGMELKIALPKP